MCPTPGESRKGDDELTLDPEEGPGTDAESAMSPEELDIENDENVVSLDDGRYVIGTDQRPTVPEDAGGGASGGSAGGASGAGGSAGGGQAQTEQSPGEQELDPQGASGPSEMDSTAVKRFLEDDLQGVSARYGFHVTAKSEDAISHQQMFSDDVGTVFDSLLRWYAQQLTTETAVEDVLGILLTESNVRVRYSPSCLQAILESYDLGPDDTIADLFETVQDDHGMIFPPENV